MVNEEHINLLSELESKCIDHIAPDFGSSKDIAQAIQECFNSDVFSLNFAYLRAFGCDGVVINTRSKNGVATQFKKAAGKLLQWLIGQLHANELLLRYQFKKLHEKTNGSSLFSENIGMELQKYENLTTGKTFNALRQKDFKLIVIIKVLIKNIY